MNRRNMLLVTAAILAVGAGLLTFNYLSTSHRQQTVPMRSVVVATAEIPAHTAITPTMVSIVSRPATDVDPGTFSSPGEVNGETSLGDIPAGSTISSANTSKDEAPQGLHLLPGYRAISIPVDEVRDVSGLVQPGDKVDVIAVPPRVGNAAPTAATILRDVTVFAVGGTIAPIAQGSPPPAGQPPVPNVPRSITLEVTPNQADLIAMADLNTSLRLALRPKGDRSGSTQSIIFASTTFAGPPASAPAPAASGAPAAAPARRAPQGPWSPVQVIDGSVDYDNGGR